MNSRLMIAAIALIMSFIYGILEMELNNKRRVFVYPAVIAYFTFGEYLVEKITPLLWVKVVYIFLGIIVLITAAIFYYSKRRNKDS